MEKMAKMALIIAICRLKFTGTHKFRPRLPCGPKFKEGCNGGKNL
jgi:hypothetical protein